MSTFGSAGTIDEGLAGYLSLAALKAAHAELLDRRRLYGDTPEVLGEIDTFIRRGCATGVVLDADAQRWAAQSVLDYWANVLYRLGDQSPDAMLAEFDPSVAPELDDALCPYVGLDAFLEPNHHLFFGRERLLGELIDRVGQHRLVAVVGPSGSGKSSLVRAGLVPALKAGALPGSLDWWYTPPIVPGSDPLA